MRRVCTKPRFEILSYIGSEIAEFRSGGECPPRSAKVVVTVDMGSGPGGGDYRTYLLSTNRERSGWILWARAADYDTGRNCYCRVAWGEPYRGYGAHYAAEHLLAKTWEDEVMEGSLAWPVTVSAAGLLTEQDIRRMERRLLGE